MDVNEEDVTNWNLVICLIIAVPFFSSPSTLNITQSRYVVLILRVKGRNLNMYTACSNICSLLLWKSSEWLLCVCFRQRTKLDFQVLFFHNNFRGLILNISAHWSSWVTYTPIEHSSGSSSVIQCVYLELSNKWYFTV